MRVSSERPAGAPGQWWHITGDVELKEGSLEVSIDCRDRSEVDNRLDHLNAVNYLDSLTNVNHLLVAQGVLPKRLRYTTLHLAFPAKARPEEPVRMYVKFHATEHGWAFEAEFRVEEVLVAKITGHARLSAKKA